jgi:hypothetical protein
MDLRLPRASQGPEGLIEELRLFVCSDQHHSGISIACLENITSYILHDRSSLTMKFVTLGMGDIPYRNPVLTWWLLSSYRPNRARARGRYAVALDVALYRPIAPDPHHWAMHVRSPRARTTLHQVADEPLGRGYYVDQIRWRVRPSRAGRFRTAIFVGWIRWADVAYVRHFIQQWDVDNVSTTWNCQEWVVELVFALLRARLLEVRWRGLTRLLSMRERWQ